MPPWLLLLALCSFAITFITLPTWIHRAGSTGLMGKDVHKKNIQVAELGGITVVLGVVVSLLLFIGLETFYFGNDTLIFLLAAVATLLIATIIGMTDDLLGWRIGLRQREKILLTILVPIPMMAVNAGHSMMNFPFIGKIELGFLYPMLIVPLGIIGSTNGFNMLAGFNGLEAGMGIIILSTLGLFALKTASIPAAVVAICFVAALLAFLYYNKFPSKIFPGDVLTYTVGAGIAVVAIMSNLERFAMMLFLPYYLEFILKSRGRFVPEWEATVLDDNSLRVKDKLYSVPHVAITLLRKIKGKAYEKDVVIVILLFELIVSAVTIISFLN